MPHHGGTEEIRSGTERSLAVRSHCYERSETSNRFRQKPTKETKNAWEGEAPDEPHATYRFSRSDFERIRILVHFPVLSVDDIANRPLATLAETKEL